MTTTLNEIRLNDRVVYNDGRAGHIDVAGTVIGKSPLSCVVLWDDRAEPTLIRNDDRAWWDHITPVRTTQVQCKNGERFDVVAPDTDAGVQFDGGTIPWDDVLGFWCWHAPTGRWMFVPVD